MQSWTEIKKIENPTPAAQKAAFEQNVQAILYIKNGLCEDLKAALNALDEPALLAAVNGDPNILKFVTNPELLKAAVRSDWKIVKKIDNASDELWAEAVRVNVDALKFVRHPGEAVLMAAVERDWTYLQEIEHPTAAIVVAAVKQDYRAFEYVSIKNRTEAVQLAAVRTDPRCIQYLQRASERVQMEAVRNNKDVFHLIKNPAEAVKEFCK